MPGVGTVLGCGVLALALNLWRGSGVSLPLRVGAFELSGLWAARVLRLLAGFYASSGRLTQPRLMHFAGDKARRWLAIKAALMAVLIILPIPFGNYFPALALMFVGLGLVASDGLAILVGTAMAALAMAFGIGLIWAAWFWGLEAFEFLHKLSIGLAA
nr:exopolysaccharide biosynthesis protein [Roseateles sp.]